MFSKRLVGNISFNKTADEGNVELPIRHCQGIIGSHERISQNPKVRSCPTTK